MTRAPPRRNAYAIERNGRERRVRHYRRHSPALDYGYTGAGPADLALSLLLDWFDADQPAELPVDDHEFMEIFIASADRRALTLEIPAEAITAWIRAYLGEGQ